MQAHVIPNQLLGSSLALHWSSSELIFQPSGVLCLARGNNRSCSHQKCYVINVTGSSAAHVMGALFHSHCLLSQYVHTAHTHTLRTLVCPNVPRGACAFSREANVLPRGFFLCSTAAATLHITWSTWSKLICSHVPSSSSLCRYSYIQSGRIAAPILNHDAP